MRIRTHLSALLLALLIVCSMDSTTHAATVPSAVNTLVRQFPALDELESHLGIDTAAEAASSEPTTNARTDSPRPETLAYPVSERWFTAALPSNPFDGTTAAPKAADKPLASLLADMDLAQKTAGEIGKQISRQNGLPINRYFLDRWSAYARTDYGTDITGLFVNGVGFGSVQQSLRQSYGASYSLPLLQRFSKSNKWTRLLSGWTVSSDFGVMPQLSSAVALQQFLNNLAFSWSVSLSYNVQGGMLRRLKDNQYDQEAALGKSAARAIATREELLRKMALRIDALSARQPVRDTRVGSLRELYPQFELYQARYEQAASCDEQMEDFFTLKGLALSLLTLAGYDRPDHGGIDLLQTWKRARFAGCGRA